MVLEGKCRFFSLFGPGLNVDFGGYFEGVYREGYVLSSTMIWTLQLNCRYRRYEVQNEVLCPNVANGRGPLLHVTETEESPLR